jgi:cytochrome c5
VLQTRGQVSEANQQPVQLPEGDGKATVQAVCGACHSLTQVTNAGYDREGWDTVLHMMVNVGCAGAAEQIRYSAELPGCEVSSEAAA